MLCDVREFGFSDLLSLKPCWEAQLPPSVIMSINHVFKKEMSPDLPVDIWLVIGY